MGFNVVAVQQDGFLANSSVLSTSEILNLDICGAELWAVWFTFSSILLYKREQPFWETAVIMMESGTDKAQSPVKSTDVVIRAQRSDVIDAQWAVFWLHGCVSFICLGHDP